MTKGCMQADDGPSGWVLIRRSSSGAAVAQSYRYTNFGKCKPLGCIYELSKDFFIVLQFFTYYHCSLDITFPSQSKATIGSKSLLLLLLLPLRQNQDLQPTTMLSLKQKVTDKLTVPHMHDVQYITMYSSNDQTDQAHTQFLHVNKTNSIQDWL